MPNKILKLPDDDGNMHYHRLCPNCHYYFFSENIGAKYCPHCGLELFWDSEIANKRH